MLQHLSPFAEVFQLTVFTEGPITRMSSVRSDYVEKYWLLEK